MNMQSDPVSKKLTVPVNERAQPPLASAIATSICGTMLVAVAVLQRWEISGNTQWALAACAVAYVAGGYQPVANALAGLLHRELNVDLLMILAAIGAAAIGDSTEGAVLLFLFSLSGTLEAFAMYRTARSIESLMRLRPPDALRIDPQDNSEQRIAVESLRVGDHVRVKPGERFPVDGIVVEGETWADEATLTGESVPIHKTVGNDVFAGTMNGHGSIAVRMTKEVGDSMLARIVQMVQDAQAQKTPTQKMIESWQRPYVIGVLVAAALVIPGARIFHSQSWYDSFYHGMVLLVAASPCAVVVSSPAVMLSAIARAGKLGVLFKGSIFLEALGRVNVIAFDKTGTVTVGRPAVAEVWVTEGTNLKRLLSLAAAVEKRSEHPLAFPIIDEARRREAQTNSDMLTDFHSHTGLGVHARLDKTWVGVGRENLFTTHGLEVPPTVAAEAQRMRELGHTALLVALAEENGWGVISVADQLRPEAASTMASLKRLGVGKVVILTGDHRHVAAKIGHQLGVDEVRAELLPEQKVLELRRLADDGSIVAMVGDGVNDAPALAAARIGIAMGGAGTDVALEVADVVLMSDDLRALPLAVWISRVAQRRVRQNMIFAFAMIGVLILASFANLPLWLGVIGHEGSTVIVVLNGLRILWQKMPPL